MSDYYSSANDPSEIKRIAEKYGFCLVKNLLTPAEVDDFESAIAALSPRYPDDFPDLVSIPELRWPLYDNRILNIARALLGEQLVHYRHGSILYEATPGKKTANPFTEFHCDARGMPDNLHSGYWPFDEIYPAYRFGVYFRDYRNASGGLKVAVGSHRMPFSDLRRLDKWGAVEALPKVDMLVGAAKMQHVHVPAFELYNVPTQPGDVVVFNLRTFHSGGALRFKDRPTLALLPAIERVVTATAGAEALLDPIPSGSRNVVFFDFGNRSWQTDLYCKWLARRMPTKDADLDTLCDEPTGQFYLRNDKVIIGLALKLTDELAKLGVPVANATLPWPLPDPHHAIAERLIELCLAHLEFGPYHPMIAADKVRALVGKNKSDALGYILAAVNASLASLQRDISNTK
ncbi:MAG: phytanoyl-CoA dioxygenase family protein [Rhodospirillaceae bacterium]|nr:phytanoyl-CoA dioxygenase family protein [Rhodospirillaceae bacterium]